MRVLVKQHIVVVPETDADEIDLSRLYPPGETYALRGFRRGGALVLSSVGLFAHVHREPINVTSRHRDPRIRLISNFAATPFALDDERYESVEGFWQALRTTDPTERRRISGLSGADARRAGQALGAPDAVHYRGRILTWASAEHWDLMRVACRAKFTQHVEAGDALRATWPQPLEHRTRIDSRSIPGVIMASIWMHLREELVLSAARARRHATDDRSERGPLSRGEQAPD